LSTERNQAVFSQKIPAQDQNKRFPLKKSRCRDKGGWFVTKIIGAETIISASTEKGLHFPLDYGINKTDFNIKRCRMDWTHK
jgi:hypothetical protein